MGGLSIWHWLVVVAVVAILFGGRGKIADVMGDVAKGIKSFRKEISDDETPKVLDDKPSVDKDSKTD